MKSLFLLVGLVLMGSVAMWSYRVNYATRDVMRHVASLERQIADERQTMAVLRAEWAYLNRPDRLLALSEKHFDALRLMPLHPDHFSDATTVAYPIPQDQLLADLINAAVIEVQRGSE